MGEDTENYVTFSPMRHDRFSVLIPTLGFMSNVFESAGDLMRSYAIMAAQHSSQLEYDRRFHEVTK